MNNAEVMRKFLERYWQNPELYVREVLKVELIEPWQLQLLTDVRAACLDATLPHWFAVRSGHGIGKTAFMAWIDHWFMATRPNPQIITTANTENQLNTKTWRELAKWNKRAVNAEWFEWTATKFSMKSAKDTWFSAAIPWSERNSEAFAGAHEDYVLRKFDEASSIPDVIWEVSEGAHALKEPSWWFVFGNPTKNTGRFAECWGKYRHRWKTYEVDARTCSIADQDQIRKWIEDEGEDSDFVRVRVKGQPPRSSMLEFIGPEHVSRCVAYKAEGYETFPKVFGIDVARFGDDKNVIAMRQGRKTSLIKTWHGLDGMQSASMIIEAIHEFDPDIVFIDDGGVGGPILDRVKAVVGNRVIGINFGGNPDNSVKWFNKRAEMWGELREAMRVGIEIPDIRELKSDLIGPLYLFSPTEQIKLERKEDMKKRGLSSPDYADAWALTYAQRVLKRRRPEEKEYDEFKEMGLPQSYAMGGSGYA